jgi:hypothetical protein
MFGIFIYEVYYVYLLWSLLKFMVFITKFTEIYSELYVGILIYEVCVRHLNLFAESSQSNNLGHMILFIAANPPIRPIRLICWEKSDFLVDHLDSKPPRQVSKIWLSSPSFQFQDGCKKTADTD